ncbi:hypothetical protein KP509_36G033900 [Ceratopteris richardii]|uniref:Uncharacterized protein n=1 Tax=Ceratopteris richardii TaxID=49495 RepID=A0A8T2QAQ3_CERRI|nr:hypothetical protein KP509_36G033900 [Ceratopteris richardii]
MPTSGQNNASSLPSLRSEGDMLPGEYPASGNAEGSSPSDEAADGTQLLRASPSKQSDRLLTPPEGSRLSLQQNLQATRCSRALPDLLRGRNMQVFAVKLYPFTAVNAIAQIQPEGRHRLRQRKQKDRHHRDENQECKDRHIQSDLYQQLQKNQRQHQLHQELDHLEQGIHEQLTHSESSFRETSSLRERIDRRLHLMPEGYSDLSPSTSSPARTSTTCRQCHEKPICPPPPRKPAFKSKRPSSNFYRKFFVPSNLAELPPSLQALFTT